MESIWQSTADLPKFPPLEGDAEAEVLVIGGGLTGLLCAWLLEREGVDCLLVEAGRICGGVTGRTTAKVTAQHGLIYSRLAKTCGMETAGRFLEANLAALERYRTMCQGIGCELQDQDSFVYTLGGTERLEREAEVLNRLGFPAEVVTEVPLPVPAAGAVRFPHQAQFHPLKFAAAIAKGLRIHEETRVLEFLPGAVTTHSGVIRAEKIILATHFPLLNKHGAYFLKLCQDRSCVLALRNVPGIGDFQGMYVDEAPGGLSFRRWGDLLLLGGGGHRTGKRGGGWAELREFAKRTWSQAEEAGWWAAQDCMTLDGMPYAGPCSRGTRGLYTATGYNKWGMTSAMVCAMTLSEQVRERESPYGDLLAPSRRMLRPQLAVNGWEAVVSLLTPTAPRCPHMGCALKYNAQEHSWDCPCHGSRFSEEGRMLDGPATGDLRKKPV